MASGHCCKPRSYCDSPELPVVEVEVALLGQTAMLRGGRLAHQRLGRFASSRATGGRAGAVALADRTLIKSISVDASLTCNSCKLSFDGGEAPLFKCPEAGDGADHVLMPSTLSPKSLAALAAAASSTGSAGHASPFIKYRALLYPYRVALSWGMSDEEYCSIVTTLDDRIKAIDGVGFVPTPLTFSDELQAFVKNESGQVAGSHKARHLFNVMTYLQVRCWVGEWAWASGLVWAGVVVTRGSTPAIPQPQRPND